ncbi:MAG: hypothetical protein J1E61_01105 [Lachnospiraceae bacterium]|nr:hypothetical protein [Lachnospiraceae bacterium]
MEQNMNQNMEQQNVDPDRILQKAAESVLVEEGLFQKGKSRMWIDDQGWFLVLVEFQPSGIEPGSYLNVGLSYLWSRRDYLSFDYGSRQHDFMAYEGDPEKFYQDMVFLAKEAMAKVTEFRKFGNLSFAKDVICKGRNLKDDTNECYQKMMICGLLKDKQAEEYYHVLSNKLKNAYYKWEKAYQKELVEHIASIIHSRDRFYEYICGKIRAQREYWHNARTGMKKIEADGFFCQ